MKFISYQVNTLGPRAGVVIGDRVIDLTSLLKAERVIEDVSDLLARYENENFMEQIKTAISNGIDGIPLNEVKLLSPVRSTRILVDYGVFEKHAKRSGENNRVGLPQSWYEKARFYFENPATIYGPDDEIPRTDGCTTLDFEAEVAFVIGKSGSNVSEEDAIEHVFGLTVFNDWSDRALCTEEIGFLSLVKAKDFASGLGPCVVTFDEFEDKYYDGKLHLKIDSWVNGKHFTDSDTNDMYYTLPYLVARLSKDSRIVAGEVVGLGTVGGGCIYEEKPEDQHYLEDGDCVEIEVERIGKLRQYVKK